jgi:hypothetical protein
VWYVTLMANPFLFTKKCVKVALRCLRNLQTPENAMRAVYPNPNPPKFKAKPNHAKICRAADQTKEAKRVPDPKKKYMVQECTSGKSEERRGAYLKATNGMSSMYISNLLPLWVVNSVDNSSVRAVCAIGHLHWCCAPEGTHTEGGLADAVKA